ncbi:M23 family metallopeptidase [Croceicoccus bisphenolivorans]|uniref:M23 family metallopeptidase n=1 Tax=Croceicoccus bisphenolivorans TaxID=1783232 RepID=UPI000A76B971|nr:M23 family metallopeptidase [Croceicoccus bisphenolivorans]
MTQVASGLSARLQNWFPDREFIMRSQGQVRFVRISAKFQKRGAAAIAALAMVWTGTMATALVNEWLQHQNAAELATREAKIATAESRVAAYRDDLGEVASDLSRRQDFIDDMVESHLGTLPTVKDVTGVQDSTAETRKTVDKVSAAVPEASGLAQMEARQLAFVEALTRLADKRAARAEAAIRTIGLDPKAIVRNTANAAMGGPFEAFTTGSKSLDPRFEKLGVSLARMSALERGLQGIPNVLPASIDMISSGFGYRRDPFNGHGAMHAGLDFRGPIGTPIHAAAKGKVSFVGWKGGYGRCVEIRHGNGLMTRYAHMSKFEAKVGDPVNAGDIVGRIGSSGRSTGPHLHFEVRINNRAVNPRPMLEKGASLLGAKRVLAEKQDGGADAPAKDG